MAGVNKAIVVGNLGADPEVRYTQGGQAVANFRMATTDNWTDKSGQKQERTEWHRIVAWGKTAELCGEYLTKGRQVYIEGRLQTREWTDKENHKNYTTEIVADKVVFLSDGRGQGQGGGGGQRRSGGAGGGGGGGGGGTSSGPGPDDFGPPPGGYDEGPSGGGRSSGGGGGSGGGAGGGPSEDDIPF